MRKALFICCALSLALALPAVSQIPVVVPQPAATPTPIPRVHNVMLDVDNVGAGGHTRAVGDELNGTNTRNHSTALKATIRNLGREDDTIHVEWYFFGRAIGHNTQEIIFDSGSRDVPLKAGAFDTVDIISKAVQSTTKVATRTSTDGYGNVMVSTSESQGGMKIDGWVVRIVADGKLLALRASDFKYEDIGKDDYQLKEMIPPEPKARAMPTPLR